MQVFICTHILYPRALKKMNEKKQVFNNYKTQRAKEEKVRVCTYMHVNAAYVHVHVSRSVKTEHFPISVD